MCKYGRSLAPCGVPRRIEYSAAFAVYYIRHLTFIHSAFCPSAYFTVVGEYTHFFFFRNRYVFIFCMMRSSSASKNVRV